MEVEAPTGHASARLAALARHNESLLLRRFVGVASRRCFGLAAAVSTCRHRAQGKVYKKMTLNYDLDFQSPASYGHDPYTSNLSRSNVTQFKKSGNRRMDRWADGQMDRWTDGQTTHHITVPLTRSVNMWCRVHENREFTKFKETVNLGVRCNFQPLSSFDVNFACASYASAVLAVALYPSVCVSVIRRNSIKTS